jgi:hypothetical protein
VAAPIQVIPAALSAGTYVTSVRVERNQPAPSVVVVTKVRVKSRMGSQRRGR